MEPMGAKDRVLARWRAAKLVIRHPLIPGLPVIYRIEHGESGVGISHSWQLSESAAWLGAEKRIIKRNRAAVQPSSPPCLKPQPLSINLV